MSDETDPVGVGLVGYGGRGSGIADRVAATPDAALRAVCDVDDDRRAAAHEEVEATTTGEFDDLLADDGIEAVVVSTGSAGHAPLSIEALEAGKHVLCSKPIAETTEEAARMIRAADRAGLVAAIGFQKRFRPGVWTLREAAAGLDPVQVLLTNQRGIYRQQFLQPGYAMGLLDGLSHWIDIASWLVDRRPVSVSANVRYGTFTPEEAIDTVSLRIEYTDGRTATVLGSMGGVGIENVRHVVGEEGNARMAGDEVAVTDLSFSEEYGEEKARQRATDRTLSPESPGEGDPTQSLVETFVSRVRGHPGEGLPTFRDGFDALRIAKAGVRSHERGETVHLADVSPEI